VCLSSTRRLDELLNPHSHAKLLSDHKASEGIAQRNTEENEAKSQWRGKFVLSVTVIYDSQGLQHEET